MAEPLHGNAHPPPPETSDEKVHAPATHAGPPAPSSVDGKEADKPDRFGEELADDAHIWRVHGKVAKEEDKERVQRWNGGLNNLALFAALFSGITTTFIIESQNDLKPDFSELAYRVQNATAHGRAYVEEPFIVPLRARVVNCLWLASLLLSLSAALIAIMGQDWIEMFVDRPVCNPRQWAQIRTFRMKGLEKWYMPGVIASAPVLLHSSLFLFGAGLIVFMNADPATQNLCIALCATTAWLYAVTMFSPVLWSSSPFRSPATVLMRRWFCAMFRPGADAQNRPARQPSEPNLPARLTTASGSSATLVASPSLSAARTLAGADVHVLTHPPGGADSLPGAAATRLARMQSVPPVPSAPAQAVVVAGESYDAEKGEPQPVARRSRLRSCASEWPRRLYSKCLAILTRFLELYGPDFTNGWIDIPKEPSPPLVAHSLSWLYTASSSPDVLRAVVTALGDQRLGREVGKAKATERVFEKIRSDVKANAWRLSLLELSRFVLVSKNLGRTDWPGRILRRFTQAIEAEKPAFVEDSLLALAYLTDGFRHRRPRGGNDAAPDPASETPVPHVGPPRLDPLCSSIPICSPITLSSIVSVLPHIHGDSRGRLVPVCNLIVIMNRWRDALPDTEGLIAINDILQTILDEEPVSGGHHLGAFCSYARPTDGPRPLDRLIHTLCSMIPQLTPFRVTLRSAVDLVIHLARMAGEVKPGGKVHTLHPCLAHVLGSDHPAIINAAWADRHARDILSATWCIGVVGFSHTPPLNFAGDDKRPLHPSLARTLVRHMSPPHVLLEDHPVFLGHRIPRGELLYDLVKAMGAEAPADLFRRVLEQSTLVDIARYNRQFWYVLAAIATWIGARTTLSDGPELFGLFVSSHGPEENSPAWNLADAVSVAMSHLDEERHCFDNNGQKRGGNSANPSHPQAPRHVANGWHRAAQKRTPGEGASEKPKEDCLTVALHFLGALERVRTAFPDSVLWADIARSVGMKRDRCPKLMWHKWREAVHRATGIDPSQFATGGTSGPNSVPSENTMNIEVTQHSSVHDYAVAVTGISSPDSSLTIPLKAAAVAEVRTDLAIGPVTETAPGQSSHRAMHAPP